MSLQDLLEAKGSPNPILKLVNNFYLVDTAFHRQINFSPETPEYRLSTKLDATRGLIEELEKLVSKGTKQAAELGSLDLTEASKTFDSLVGSDSEEEVFLQALLDFGFEEAWSQAQEKSEIAQEFVTEFLAASDRHIALKKEVENLIRSDLKTLKEKISDEQAYEHIIASILEIYTDKLPYNQVLEQIFKDVKNINEPENTDTWGAIYSLAILISCNEPTVKCLYQQEILEDKEAWEREMAGEIYNYIDQNS